MGRDILSVAFYVQTSEGEVLRQISPYKSVEGYKRVRLG